MLGVWNNAKKYICYNAEKAIDMQSRLLNFFNILLIFPDPAKIPAFTCVEISVLSIVILHFKDISLHIFLLASSVCQEVCIPHY